jgi:ribosome-binding factor A
VGVRQERIALAMQREVSDILSTLVKDPRIGFVTVTGVELSRDYAYAKVFVSVLGDDDKRKESLAALDRAKGFVRTEVGRRIRLRVTPDLTFRLDTSLDYSERIGSVLTDIARAQKTRETADDKGPVR